MKKQFKQFMSLIMAFLIMFTVIPFKGVAEEQKTFEASNFEELKQAVETINNEASDDYIIKLTGDIDFADSGYDCYFKENVTILGNGHKIDLGNVQSHGQLGVMENKILSLGADKSPDESKLTITASMKDDGLRSDAAIRIGNGQYANQAGTLNIYDGVEITGFKTNGASPGSAVNIENGIFNMYGGSIHHNTTEAQSGIGGAVSSASWLVAEACTFNMHGGRIYENETQNDWGMSIAGGGVHLERANFTMRGGTIEKNRISANGNLGDTRGGGVAIYSAPSEIILEGGKISNNEAVYGGGLFVEDSKVNIKNGFILNGNYAIEMGGGITVNGDVELNLESGAVIANNTAASKGDDIANYNGKINLSPAEQMNTRLTTDGSNKLIDGWYMDDTGARWGVGNANLVDISNTIEGDIFLKAAHNGIIEQTATFINEDAEYAKVKVETGKAIDNDDLTDESMPQNPTKSGYTFKEWNTQKDGKGIAFTGTTVVNEDMTVYAIYSKNAIVINEAPKLEVTDKTIEKGENLDLKDLVVSATDKEDGDLKSKVELVDNGGFDKDKAGKYTITFKVTDKDGASTTKKATVTVIEKDKPKPNPDDNKPKPNP
ncbi:InlB B-repeat-containing protein, partial [Peptostreptococcus sp. D1]|uniref:InlB B-repeat-containing protein n=1 Tax=Peptostreptococcus sp. D1 TaxID=72304 RepID=UPI0008F2F130